MNKKFFGIMIFILISLVAVNAQYECEWNGDCPGGTCIVEQGRSYCKYSEVQPPTDLPITPPSLPPEQPIAPPALPPETAEVKQCPPNTVPVMENGMFYCLEMEPTTPGVEPVIPQPGISTPSYCASKIFYIPEGEESTELTFSLPWIPEEAYLVREGRFLPVNFDNQELVLSLGKGDYLIKAVNDGEEFNLPFQVLEVPEQEELPMVSPISAEVLVHAQGGDEEQGKLLVDYFKKLGLNAQFSNAKNVESVNSAEILIFLGGNLANNLVSKYFPDISESLFNLNTNSFVKQMGDQFVMSFASWCADGTKTAVDELKDELSYELAEGTDENVKGLLTNRVSRRGKRIVCMPEPPELVEDLKGRRKSNCPNAELCDNVCNLKLLELHANDDAYRDFGLPTSYKSAWDERIARCSCTVYAVDALLIYHNSNHPINARRYCGEGGRAKFDEDFDDAVENARNSNSERYNAENRRGKTELVNGILVQRDCSGADACQRYCGYELSNCKNGRRNSALTKKDGSHPFADYPSNDCAGYNKFKGNYDERDASCTCTFAGENYEHGLDADYMTPSMLNHFCDLIEEEPVRPAVPGVRGGPIDATSTERLNPRGEQIR